MDRHNGCVLCEQKFNMWSTVMLNKRIKFLERQIELCELSLSKNPAMPEFIKKRMDEYEAELAREKEF